MAHLCENHLEFHDLSLEQIEIVRAALSNEEAIKTDNGGWCTIDHIKEDIDESFIFVEITSEWIPPMEWFMKLCTENNIKATMWYAEQGCDIGGLIDCFDLGECDITYYHSYLEAYYNHDKSLFYDEVEFFIDEDMLTPDRLLFSISEKDKMILNERYGVQI